MDDKRILRIYETDPELALEIFNEKYRETLESYNNIYFFSGLESQKIDIKNIVQTYASSINGEEKKVILPSDNCVGAKIYESFNILIAELYGISTKEIPLESYREYLLMVAGKTGDQLLVVQMKRFNYIARPLTSEEDQIFDSLNILETYLFDAQGDGFAFSPEQKAVIDISIREIKACMEEKDLHLAKLKLVFLQMLMGLDVRFYSVLKEILINNYTLREFIDYGDISKGKGKIK